MNLRPCKIVITNKVCKRMDIPLRGGMTEVAVLETVITDAESGAVLNTMTSHMAARDTLTFETFYDGKLSDK